MKNLFKIKKRIQLSLLKTRLKLRTIRKYKVPKMYDSNGLRLKVGQICECSPGSIVKHPYKVLISNCHESNLTHDGMKVKTPYLVTGLLSGAGHKSVMWPYWSKRLTIIK